MSRRRPHSKVLLPPATVFCQYCKRPAKRVTGAVVYPHRKDLVDRVYYHCAPCRAHVGCHPGSITPLGKLADPELRRARLLAHEAFDPLWKKKGMRRPDAYRWLAERLGIPFRDCHIGQFDLPTCRRVIIICEALP